ncbi:nucleoside recognition domain-containing protein [secondary endosymbiont of Heteropsylla cubana]|uniref:nucleoside recognition domain-containing protein n=1 Tax=secondary endosymbiont of Heteropsylla cubana TaxID=134287 RepID=UPI0002F08351|nr:nucleoside recognition domain-containing protein [secondary endosymbiont of Heteropsylla cubana]
MGIYENNWQTTTSIISGMITKEMVVGTLNTLYATEKWLNYHLIFEISNRV